ncbi:MAG: helix-turn-helix transcriptional regulator [Erysipelotrichaceae bacterium]|nr:helix-turn-helix transcriptional regulator [Erysipelotrichaceae bacterium]MBR3036443.1 helix-turn-helix transcriptional regulator [Lachnospiraceae bacterium]
MIGTTDTLTVKQIRAILALSQKQFAPMIGMTPSALMRRENGKIPWKMHEISKVSAVTGVPIERIRA